MNKCKICGSWTPEGKELCWLCEHTHRLPETKEQPEEECEMCKIPLPEEKG